MVQQKHLITWTSVALSVLAMLLLFIFIVPGFPLNIMLHTHHIAEFSAVLVAMFTFRYLRNSFMKWFLPYHFYILVAELVVWYMAVNRHNYVRHSVNLLTTLLASLFYGYVFFHFTTNRKRKKMIQVFTIMILLFDLAGAAAFFLDLTKQFVMYNWIVSGFVSTTIGLIYLYDWSDSSERQTPQSVGYWLALGVCLFYSGISITSIAAMDATAGSIKVFGEYLSNLVTRLLCVVLYGCTCITMVGYARPGFLSTKITGG